MKKLILILALMFCLIFSVNTLAFEKVDVTGTNFYTDVIFRAKIVTFLEQLNFTELAITDALNNGRQIHWQFTATAIEAGEQLTGIQLRSNWGGTADAPAAGIVGVEIKARADSESITHTLGQARAIVGNVDVKKATFTVAHVFEGQVDVSSGGEITTLKNFRASLNNSGTIGTSYAFIVETANTALNWDYGFYCTDGQADTGVSLGSWAPGLAYAAIAIGTYSTPITLTSPTTDHYVGIAVNLEADIGEGNNIIPILSKFTTTGDAGATAIVQNIYSSVNVDHELSDAYGVRTKMDISPTDGETLNLMLALYSQLVVDDGAITISSEMSAGLFDVDVSAVVTTGNVTGININMNDVTVDNSSTVYGLYIGLEAGCYVDYGIRIALAPNVGITAAQEFYITQGAGSCIVAKGIRFETHTEASQAFTYGIAFDGTVNYVFEFEDGDGTGGADTASGDDAYCDTDAADSDGAIRIWVNGEAFFIPIYDATSTGNSW